MLRAAHALCPFCGAPVRCLRCLGRKGGRAKSEAKTRAARANALARWKAVRRALRGRATAR